MKRHSAEVEPDLLYGVNPVLEQLRRDPRAMRRILVAREGGAAARIVEEARRARVAVSAESTQRLERLTGGAVHQGVVAEMAPFRYADWHEMLACKPRCLVVADQVTDPRNLGALARSAEAAGADGLVIPRDRSAGVNATVAKAAAGATAFLPIAQVTNLARALREVKDGGAWVVGLEGRAPQTLFGFEFPERCALVAGSEGGGLRPVTRSSCDFLVSVPMAGRVESLNVSVATAVALFERLRQVRGGQRQEIDTPPSR